jgi:CheY-like chemotaxis protein/GGDEF domain-containing protein
VAKARILAIDDQLYFRSYIEGLLSEEGYSVRTADGGPAGLDFMEHEGPFDLVLTDLVMPGLDGIETIKRIRQRWPEQQVIIVTGVGDVRSAVEGVRLGAADYLLKPIERDDLIRAIESVLERRQLRQEHARLLSENTSFLGLLSVLDRGIGLLALPEHEEVANGLLELLCVEARAKTGALWLREAGSEQSGWTRRAVHGTTEGYEAPERLALSGSLAEPLARGEMVHEAPPEGQPSGKAVLWVPSLREGKLWAVARLSDPAEGSFGHDVRSACRKLGEIGALALANADRAEELARGGLRDTHTGVHTLNFLEEAVSREAHRGHRYGRSFALLCLQIADSRDASDPGVMRRVAGALERSLRPTEVVASEGLGRFWVLVPEADALGCVVVKRRLVHSVAAELGGEWPLLAGAARFPVDGELFEQMAEVAVDRLEADRDSLLRALPLSRDLEASAIASRLRERAATMAGTFVGDAVQLVLDEVRSRPEARGLIFLAPGFERSALMNSLLALGQRAVGTEVFLASDGDTVPAGEAVTALPLPRGLSADLTWLVRFGEAPPYLLLAGPPGGDEGRLVFHSDDASLVEYVAFQLRSEVGFGVGRDTCAR